MISQKYKQKTNLKKTSKEFLVENTKGFLNMQIRQTKIQYLSHIS